MSHYRIAIVGRFEQRDDCASWCAYQDLKLAGHAVEMVETSQYKGLLSGGTLDEEMLRPFVEVFEPDYIAWRGEAADEILQALANVPAHEGPAPRRFVVCGYVGRNNFGDEFLFKTICGRLRHDWPGASVELIGYDPAASLARHGVVSVKAQQKAQVNALLNGASALIFMGGLLTDMQMEKYTAGPIEPFFNAESNIPGQTAIAELAWLNAVPVFFLGIGAGPLENPDAQRLVQLGSLTRPRYLTRDEETARLLLEAGVDASLVSQAADLAFSADYPEGAVDAAREQVAAEAGSIEGYVVWALREQEPSTGQIEAAAAATADRLYAERGLASVFVAFEPVDAQMHERLRGRMEHPEAALLASTDDFDATTGLIGGAAFVVAMRLHCTIIAAAQGVPSIGLDYNVKVAEVYGQLGMEDFLLPLDATGEQLAGACLRLLDAREDCARRVGEGAARNRRLADEAFGQFNEAVAAQEPSPTRQFDYPRSVSEETLRTRRAQGKLKRTQAQLQAERKKNAELQDELDRLEGGAERPAQPTAGQALLAKEERSEDLFSVEDNFFVITSDNLDEVQTRLYGWCIASGRVVTDAADLRGLELSPEGCYVLIERDGGSIALRQDAVGCYGLYLFREGDFWAVGNSFLYLIDRLKGGHRLSFDEEYADQLLALDVCSEAYGRTMVREISWLDRSAVVNIDVAGRSLDVSLVDRRENSVDLDSAEGMALLDSWYGKWTEVIRGLDRQGGAMRTDLSGGFDSRETFGLFLGSGIDLNGVCVNSIHDELHTHKDDYEIASAIAKAYRFELNRTDKVACDSLNYSPADALNISFYSKLCFHKQMYWARSCRSEYLYTFSVAGGGCLRSHWADESGGSREKHIENRLRMTKAFKEEGPKLADSLRTILQEAFDGVEGKFEALGYEDRKGDVVFSDLYRETRNRNHFGRAKVENFFKGELSMTPLMDSSLQMLKSCTEGCTDQNLLYAVMLDRYNPELLDFPFDSGRKIDADTIECAHELNRRFPIELPAPSADADLSAPSPAFPLEKGARNEPVTQGELHAALEDAFYSPAVKGAFRERYSEDSYRHLASCFKRSFHPESEAFSVLAVGKIVRDCRTSEDATEPGRASDYALGQAACGSEDVRAEVKESARLASENKKLRAEGKKSAAADEKLKAENTKLKAENARLKRVEQSRSYKLGRALTAIPRKLRDGSKD